MITPKDILRDSGVYKITNTVNGMCYIGSSYNCLYRFKQHLSLLRKGRGHNKLLQEDFNKYGEDNFKFEVIKYTPEYEDLEFNIISKVEKDKRYNLVCNSKAHNKRVTRDFVSRKEHTTLIKYYENKISTIEQENENLRRKLLDSTLNLTSWDSVEKISNYWATKYEELTNQFIEERHQLYAEIRDLRVGIDIPNRKSNVIYLPPRKEQKQEQKQEQEKKSLLDKLKIVW